MSVLACDRSDCPNIMCDRLILDDSRYICEDCWQELLLYKASWPNTMPQSEVRERIVQFMRTDPGTHTTIKGEDIDDEFDRLTDNWKDR
jgi:hypothetical protein